MNNQWIDVHGAGAQRSDPKDSSAAAQYASTGHGPQGDAVRGNNYVRCVMDSSTTTSVSGNPSSTTGETQTQPSADGQTQPPSGQSAQGQDQADGQNRPVIDFVAAAAELGVTEDALRSALGAPPPDFAAAAAQLGVTEQALIDALGLPAGGPPNGGGQGQQSPPNQN